MVNPFAIYQGITCSSEEMLLIYSIFFLNNKMSWYWKVFYLPKKAFGTFFRKHFTNGAPKVKLGTKWLTAKK